MKIIVDFENESFTLTSEVKVKDLYSFIEKLNIENVQDWIILPYTVIQEKVVEVQPKHQPFLPWRNPYDDNTPVPLKITYDNTGTVPLDIIYCNSGKVTDPYNSSI